MKKPGRSSKPEASMSPAEQWDALNEQVLAKQPPQQALAAPHSYTWGEDEIDLPPLDSTVTTIPKKGTIDFLLYMFDPPVRLISSEDDRDTYVGARHTQRQIDSPRDNFTLWHIDPIEKDALVRFQSRLVANPTYDYRVPLPESHSSGVLSEARFRILIGKMIRKLKAPYKVGASLYIYHQMHFLEKSPAPSLGQSRWLVDNAPLHQTQPIPQRRRGDHRKIGENWGRYFPASHYWAAFVVIAGDPFVLPDDALARFLRTDVDEFKRLAATFLHFRRSLKAATTTEDIRHQQHIFRALETDLTRADFGDTLPMPDIEIPSLVADFQWQWLRHYSSDRQEPALRSPRKSEPAGW